MDLDCAKLQLLQKEREITLNIRSFIDGRPNWRFIWKGVSRQSIGVTLNPYYTITVIFTNLIDWTKLCMTDTYLFVSVLKWSPLWYPPLLAADDWHKPTDIRDTLSTPAQLPSVSRVEFPVRAGESLITLPRRPKLTTSNFHL